jgi:hypothetical protein
VRNRLIVGAVLAALLALSACGSSGSTGAPTSTSNPFENASWERAGPTPSISAKMICQKEARDEIAASLLRPATRVTKGQWDKSHHLYACTYVYPNGQMTLSVKELSNGTQTTNYFNGLVAKYGKAQPLSIGQGGWLLKNGNVVVRKDYKVLLVDDTKIPPMFAQLMKRSDVGISVASVIMSCWTGA